MWYLALCTTLPMQRKSISVVPLWDNNSTTHLCVPSGLMNQTQLTPQPRLNVLICQRALSCRFSAAPICVTPFSGAGSYWCCRQRVVTYGVSSQSQGQRMCSFLENLLRALSCFLAPHNKKWICRAVIFPFYPFMLHFVGNILLLQIRGDK